MNADTRALIILSVSTVSATATAMQEVDDGLANSGRSPASFGRTRASSPDIPSRC